MRPSDEASKAIRQLSDAVWKIKPEMPGHFRDCLASVCAMEGLRAIIVDLTDGPEYASERRERTILKDIAVPLIAAASGRVCAWKADLALQSHLCFSDNDAKFELPEFKEGKFSSRELGSFEAGSLVEAKRLVLEGRLNYPLCPGNALEQAVETAKNISQMAPLAVRAAIRAVGFSDTLDLEEGLRREIELFASLFETEDARIGTLAFLNKETPRFTGN